MRFFQGVRAIVSGKVVWRSDVIDANPYPKFEVIAKQVGNDRTIVLKIKVGAGDYVYDAISPEVATELGRALITGADRLKKGQN